jgi:hypothetical protein
VRPRPPLTPRFAPSLDRAQSGCELRGGNALLAPHLSLSLRRRPTRELEPKNRWWRYLSWLK